MATRARRGGKNNHTVYIGVDNDELHDRFVGVCMAPEGADLVADALSFWLTYHNDDPRVCTLPRILKRTDLEEH